MCWKKERRDESIEAEQRCIKNNCKDVMENEERCWSMGEMRALKGKKENRTLI